MVTIATFYRDLKTASVILYSSIVIQPCGVVIVSPFCN